MINSSIVAQDITLIRGDTHIITFTIKGENGENYIIDERDKLYFTVKESYYNADCVLQKTIGDGISFNTDTQEYEIELTDECTCDLRFCRFVYDIELVIVRDDKKRVKTLARGNLNIDREATHRGNEV